MASIEIEALRARVRGMGIECGGAEAVARWREDFEEARANLAIEGMPLDAADEAMFAMMIEEGVPPATMVAVLDGIYGKDSGGDAAWHR